MAKRGLIINSWPLVLLAAELYIVITTETIAARSSTDIISLPSHRTQLHPRFSSYQASHDAACIVDNVDNARRVIKRKLKPRCLSQIASYDVSSDMRQALTA